MEMNMDPLDHKEAMAVLRLAPVAHLGVVVDGDPYVTPMSFVVEHNTILFRTLPGRKLEGMRAHPNVCVEVSRYDEKTGDWVSVIVKGSAREVENAERSELVVGLLLEKYREVMGSPLQAGGIHPIIGLPHVIEVEIEEISGLISGRGWGPRTKPGRL
jgi:uncharacterized protein